MKAEEVIKMTSLGTYIHTYIHTYTHTYIRNDIFGDLLTFLYSGFSTEGERERVLFVGPTEPITK